MKCYSDGDDVTVNLYIISEILMLVASKANDTYCNLIYEMPRIG